MSNKRFVVYDFDEVRNEALINKFNVFTLLYADEFNNSYHFRKDLIAFLTLYHVNISAKFFDNVIRPEGIELEFIGTDFGLKEIILNKIK